MTFLDSFPTLTQLSVCGTNKSTPHYQAKYGLVSHSQRMADLTGCTAATEGGGQGQLWAGSERHAHAAAAKHITTSVVSLASTLRRKDWLTRHGTMTLPALSRPSSPMPIAAMRPAKAAVGCVCEPQSRSEVSNAGPSCKSARELSGGMRAGTPGLWSSLASARGVDRERARRQPAFRRRVRSPNYAT